MAPTTTTGTHTLMISMTTALRTRMATAAIRAGLYGHNQAPPVRRCTTPQAQVCIPQARAARSTGVPPSAQENATRVNGTSARNTTRTAALHSLQATHATERACPIKILVQDTQSDGGRCAAVTSQLIQSDGVDIVLAGGAPETMIPSADQCEALGTPGLFIQGPWQPFFYERGGTPDNNPFKWGNALCVGIEAMAACFVDMWDQVSTNKKIGLLYPNTTDGQAWANEENGGPFFFAQGGYTYTMPSFYSTGTENYTQQIAEFKKFGAEICSGQCIPPDFTNFWQQCLQGGFQPKICTMGQALNFYETVSAIGPTAYGLTTEISWHPDYPYKSSLTGQTCREIADAYEADTGRYWSAELIFYSLMEWFVEAIKNTANVDDKEAVLAAILGAKLETIYGPVDFSIPVDPAAQTEVSHPVPNCLRMPTAGGQWLKGEKWDYEKFLVSNLFVPVELTTTVQEIQYS